VCAKRDISIIMLTCRLGDRDTNKTHLYPTKSYTQGTGVGDLSTLSKKKQRHRSSSDSSLLELAPKPISPPQIAREGVSRRKRGEEESLLPHKRRRVEQSDLEKSEQSNAPKESFKKRARHKTREDRYEPRKDRIKGEHREKEKEPKRKREKQGDRKNAAKKAGEDLINNFSSKSIGQERLTVCFHS